MIGYKVTLHLTLTSSVTNIIALVTLPVKEKGEIMPSQKPRISTYTDEKTIRKFKIIAAYNNVSMSDYVKQLINDAIEKHEAQHGEIKLSPEGG